MKNIFVLSVVCIVLNLIVLESNAQDTYQWDVFRFQQQENEQKKQIDSLKLVLKNRWTIGISVGYFWMPGYTKTEMDKNTGVDMRDKKNIMSVSLEYFLSQKTRVGLEVGYHPTEQNFEPHSGGEHMRIEGGGGMNIPLLAYTKTTFLEIQQNKNKKRRTHYLWDQPADRINIPHLFVTAGAGITNTILVRVRGNPSSSIRKSLYEQVPFTCELGIGMFQRIEKNFAFEMILKYQFSSNYSPSIGSVNSYSGVNLSLRMSIIGNGGFNKVGRNSFRQ